MRSIILKLFFAFMLATTMVAAVMTKVVPRVAIIGGGPTGLASAIALHELGWSNITILEQKGLNEFDFGKSYTYNIDGRGHRLLKSLSLWKELKQAAIPFINKDAKINIIRTSGDLQRKNLPVSRNSPEGDDRLALPRHSLLQIFIDRIDQINRKHTETYGHPCIHLLHNTICDAISLDANTGSFTLQANMQNDLNINNVENGLNPIACDFLVGCDGMNSVVRNWLQTAPISALEYSNILDSNFQFLSKEFHGIQALAAEKKFGLTSYDVDSAGLLYKFLLISPHQRIPLKDTPNEDSSPNKSIQFCAEEFYAIRGTQGQSSIGFLPMNVEGNKTNVYRTANFIRKPNHPLWQLKNASEVKSYLEISFPQIDWNRFVSNEELERFAKATPGRFPRPQHVQGMQIVFYGSAKHMSKKQPTAIAVLAGDAAHAFPPDLGQGVTAALEDVRVLAKSLSEHPDSIERGLRAYEAEQLPEAVAICKLIVHGYPDQYNQQPLRRFIRELFAGLRLIFSRILPTVVSPPIFFLLQDHSLNYRQVWRRRQDSNRNILKGLLLIVATLLTRMFPQWFRSSDSATVDISSKTLKSLSDVSSTAPAQVKEGGVLAFGLLTSIFAKFRMKLLSLSHGPSTQNRSNSYNTR